MNRLAQILFYLLLLPAGTISAQSHEAEAVLSRDQIRIGEQVELKVAVRYREGSKKSVVIWPELKDTLSKNIDIVKADSIVTQLANRASVLYEQKRTLLITAFDSGMYVIPALQFIVDDDTIATQPLQLYVNTVPVDTTQPIKDIKSIYDVPPPPVEVNASNPVPWWVWAIGGVILLGIAFFVFYLSRKKKVVTEIIPTPVSRNVLPHEKYLEQLAELGRKKQWMNGEVKQYHIALTEILRSWLVERYHIHAKEMTTVEIIRTLYSLRANATAVMELERALRMADMVKFAKWNASDMDNENSLRLAINFVQATAEYPSIQPQPQLGFQR